LSAVQLQKEPENAIFCTFVLLKKIKKLIISINVLELMRSTIFVRAQTTAPKYLRYSAISKVESRLRDSLQNCSYLNYISICFRKKISTKNHFAQWVSTEKITFSFKLSSFSPSVCTWFPTFAPSRCWSRSCSCYPWRPLSMHLAPWSTDPTAFGSMTRTRTPITATELWWTQFAAHIIFVLIDQISNYHFKLEF
jgi:hypothetical protein